MRILIAAIGKLKDDEERGILARYTARLARAGKAHGFQPVEIAEYPESRAATAELRRSQEADKLRNAASGFAVAIALDSRGQTFSSGAFAALLGGYAANGRKSCAFLIGGPDGHGASVLEACDVSLSLGPMTLPHGLARVVLAEQLYRAATILSGHPYHRA